LESSLEGGGMPLKSTASGHCKMLFGPVVSYHAIIIEFRKADCLLQLRGRKSSWSNGARWSSIPRVVRQGHVCVGQHWMAGIGLVCTFTGQWYEHRNFQREEIEGDAISYQGDPSVVLEKLSKLLEVFQMPINLHWYVWDEVPNFDRNYPYYFPAKPGFSEAVAKLQVRAVARIWNQCLR